MASSASQVADPQPQGGPSFVLDPLLPTSPQEVVEAAKTLLLEYGRFVASQSGVASFCFGSLEQEVASLPESYANHDGSAGAFLARRADPLGQCNLAPNSPEWIGFVAWRTLPIPDLTDSWEIKRLWVRPPVRGTGAGRGLMQAVIERATAAGKTSLLLDTAPDAMGAAVGLYENLGFVPCPPYAGKTTPGIVYMRKHL